MGHLSALLLGEHAMVSGVDARIFLVPVPDISMFRNSWLAFFHFVADIWCAADTAKGRASKNLKVLIGKTTLAYWQQRILIYACI